MRQEPVGDKDVRGEGKFQGTSRTGFIRHPAPAALLAFAGLVLLLAIGGTVSANPPASVEISYDESTGTVEVTILHIVADPSTHYIRTVEIRKNGQIIENSDYTSQPSASSPFTYRYSIPAEPGDTLEATAICNIAGSRSATTVVPGTTAKPSASPSGPVGTTKPTSASAGASLLIPFAALAGAGVALLIKRD